ncbi:MAG: S8 family serine peptidase [Polyangiaceae bacterium]
MLSGGQTVNVVLDAASSVTSQLGANQIASFLREGPRISDELLKPDIAAPGQAILSAGVASGNRAVELSGTSMACPMVARTAALVREVHPEFGPSDIKQH